MQSKCQTNNSSNNTHAPWTESLPHMKFVWWLWGVNNTKRLCMQLSENILIPLIAAIILGGQKSRVGKDKPSRSSCGSEKKLWFIPKGKLVYVWRKRWKKNSLFHMCYFTAAFFLVFQFMITTDKIIKNEYSCLPLHKG